MGQAGRTAAWSDQIPDEQWPVYRAVVSEARSRGLRFALGGAFAIANYTGRWRDTKDLDLYILQRDRDAMVEVLTDAGLSDYFEKAPYDHGWIYRGYRDGVIVDAIWSMANRRALVDEIWVSGGPEIEIRGELLRVVPAEELLWNMLYVLQRDRCDWPECLNLLYAAGRELDWTRLLRRLGDDKPLLAAALWVFRWMFPGRAQELPEWLWPGLHVAAPEPGPAPPVDRDRVALIDSRPWFAF